MIWKPEDKARVNRWIKRWRAVIFAESRAIRYASTINFRSGPCKSDSDNSAMIEFRDQYRHFTITFYPRFLRESPEEQERTVIHELLHVLTAPTANCADRLLRGELVTQHEIEKAHEQLADDITLIIWNHWRKKK